ncbi:hypothetical protein BDV93DRAFT_513337 [Ceratobasidium sp. AG-I]|nr:hypothetical protein BDV93DRAFT_513337 [Ceratobasidium sp. AG-I]
MCEFHFRKSAIGQLDIEMVYSTCDKYTNSWLNSEIVPKRTVATYKPKCPKPSGINCCLTEFPTGSLSQKVWGNFCMKWSGFCTRFELYEEFWHLNCQKSYPQSTHFLGRGFQCNIHQEKTKFEYWVFPDVPNAARLEVGNSNDQPLFYWFTGTVLMGCAGLWWGTRSGLAYGVCGNSPWARVECRVLDMRQPLPKGQVPGVGHSVCLSYGVCTTAGGLGPGNSSYIGVGTAGCLRNIPMVVIGSTSDHTASAPLLEAL